jgi:hypothetical protein
MKAGEFIRETQISKMKCIGPVPIFIGSKSNPASPVGRNPDNAVYELIYIIGFLV